ncbi:HAD-IA family hydrolase [Kitasatospora sp. NPDC094015]|uniref:HAD family hydrolase n=1 Tax=Kitasatospora sp. NPDC094015 TaxID=3155205 RepID=UPI003320BA8D
MPRLVLVDLDHTLVERRCPTPDWTAEFCTAQGLPPAAVAPVLLAPKPETFTGLAATYGLTRSGRSLWAEYVDGLADQVYCLPGAVEALGKLRAAGWTVVVLTNGYTAIQGAKLARTGLVDAVDAVCISEEAGARKPDPEIFRVAARRCGHDLAAGAWMVGNNPATDILGAQAAGVGTIWISPSLPWRAEHPAPDHTVPDVPAAAALLLGPTLPTVG